MSAQQEWPVTSVFNTSGVAVCALPNRVPGVRYTIQQVVVTTTSALTTTAQVQKNGQPICTTAQGNGDVAAGEPPVDVAAADIFRVAWTGGTPGAQATALFIYNTQAAN